MNGQLWLLEGKGWKWLRWLRERNCDQGLYEEGEGRVGGFSLNSFVLAFVSSPFPSKSRLGPRGRGLPKIGFFIILMLVHLAVSPFFPPCRPPNFKNGVCVCCVPHTGGGGGGAEIMDCISSVGGRSSIPSFPRGRRFRIFELSGTAFCVLTDPEGGD